MRRAALVVAAGVVACASGEKNLAVRSVFVVPGAGMAPGAVYATVDNPGAADTLTSVELDDGSRVMLHDTAMQTVERLPIPAKGQLRLKPGGIHGMVAHVPSSATPGDSVRVTFFFSAAGQVTVWAGVIDYAQVDSALDRGGRER